MSETVEHEFKRCSRGRCRLCHHVDGFGTEDAVMCERPRSEHRSAPAQEGKCGLPYPDGEQECVKPKGHEGLHRPGLPAPERKAEGVEKSALAKLDDLLFRAGLRACLCFVCKHQANGVPCESCGCKNERPPEPAPTPGRAWWEAAVEAERMHREYTEKAFAAQPSGWQPIVTAPKDGGAVLGYFGQTAGDEPPDMAVTRHVEGVWVSTDEPSFEYDEPTHWMPLPEPPRG